LLFEKLKGNKMKITLRKANALQNSINEALRHIDVKTKVSLNEFQDPESVISVSAAEAKKNLDRKVSLNNALYDIRGAVGHVNHTSGVDEKLTEVARIEKQIQLYSALLGIEVREAPAVIAGKLDKVRNTEAKSRIYGYGDTVDTGVLTAEDVTGFKAVVANLKKQKQTLQDAILELNVRNEVTLKQLTADTLAQENLL
jgi:uncharacterized protein YdcH (DUF465 family)